MKKTFIILISIFCSGLTTTNALMSKDDAGTKSGQFLKLGAGARATALGEAFTGISNDATAIYWNPSGLNQIENKTISLTHSIWFADVFYDNLFYVHPTQIGKFGLGIQYVNYGSIEGTDENGNPTDNFNPTDLAITISYARKVKEISLGANIKYISSKIDETATAYAVDIGAMKSFIGDKLNIGLVIQNLGTGLKYIEEESQLPMNIKVGAGYKIKENLIIALDTILPSDNQIIIGLGGEYNYKINQDIELSLRAGYNTITKDINGLKGISLGLGGNYKNYILDYAFVPFGDLGMTHRISFGVKF